MKRFCRKIVCALCLGLLLNTSGCFYANMKIPYDDELNQTHLGTKVGKASVRSILWLIAWGDEGIAAAAKNGDMTQVNHADQEIFIILWGLYAQHTIVVYGD